MTETSFGIELFCYQAECGDAIRIRYIGNDDNPHNIFLDSGYERTYRHILRQEIYSLIQAGESIDLWVISHIHDDHIGGAVKYIKSIENQEIKDIVNKWFYNPPRNYPIQSNKEVNNISSAASIGQGDKLYDFLCRNNKLREKDITTDLGEQDFFGMRINILSPTSSILAELRNKFQSGIPFDENEVDTISYATSAVGFDYDKKIEDFNLYDFCEDTSLENGSSISLLFEYKNKKVLWLADSHPSTIIRSLKQKGYSEINPLNCDYAVLSHHASKGNNSSLLFNMIKCDKYVISSNGENKYCLPNKEVFARIVRNGHRALDNKYFLYFTYNTDNLKTIFLSDSSSVFNIWNFETIFSMNKYLYFH